MKRNLLLLMVTMLLGFAATAQVIYQDDFDSYNPGDYLAVVSPDWTTWSNQPGGSEDALITDAQSSSPSNSVIVEGAVDVVYPIANYTAGAYKMTFEMYVPSGFNGYFNLLQVFAGASSEWGMQVFFDVGGQGSIDGGGEGAASFSYSYDTWMLIENVIDLDNDWAEFYIDGNLIHGWVWSTGAFGTGALNQLGGMDMFAWSDNGPCKYYFDDVVFEGMSAALYEDDFESYNVGDFLAVENPDWWTTWTNQPGSAEDAPITDEMALSGTQSVLVEGSTDAILKLGNKTSGQYQLNFNYYIPSGFGGYFNIQHFETPGIEWAYEVYFGSNGVAELSAGGTGAASFNFNHDTWMLIENNIDLDADWAELYVDGTLIYEWQFSLLANGGQGEKQLGGMDLFAGAPTGDTPKFYMDDLVLMGSGGTGNPTIAVDPMSLTESLNQGGASTQMITIENTGEQDLTFDMYIAYGPPSTKSASTNQAPPKKVMLSLPVESPEPTNGGSPEPTDDVTLHYDGDNASAVGLTDGGVMTVGARFPASMVNEYAGMELYQMEVFINDPPNSTAVKIFNYGLPNIPGPGELLYEEQWSFSPGVWNYIDLSTPVFVNGGDLWVTYAVDHLAGTFPGGTDGGPAHPDGDWISTGAGWSHLAPTLDYNWNVRAVLTGDPLTQWLSVDPATGTVTAGSSEDVDVNFNATGVELGTHTATIVVNNNDPNNSQVEVEVTLDVMVGINELEKTAVMIYPNPAFDYLNIKSDDQITRVQMISLMGQVLYNQDVDAPQHSIDLSNLQSGVYIVKIDTRNGVVTHRITVE